MGSKVLGDQPQIGSLGAEQLAELAHCQVRVIGLSVEGQPLHGICAGDPSLPLVSVVAGAHPDEPLGPMAALRLVRDWPQNPLAQRIRLAVVPILDIDGSIAQEAWLTNWGEGPGFQTCLEHRLRRRLGADREFAWPGQAWSGTVLPESAAADEFFAGEGPAIAHLTLHGMLASSGAWFLLCRRAMSDRILWQDLQTIAEQCGLGLHDMPRNGDKGFRRAGRGFCTIPNGVAMRRWLCQHQGEPLVPAANSSALSSMEAACRRARSLGAAEPLCAVSEFPLFILPDSDGRGVEGLREAIQQAALGDGPFPLKALPPSMIADAMAHMVERVAEAALRRLPRVD
jgi:hypothetical protein